MLMTVLIALVQPPSAHPGSLQADVGPEAFVINDGDITFNAVLETNRSGIGPKLQGATPADSSVCPRQFKDHIVKLGVHKYV
jgi:hypothetical protein